MKTIKKGKEPNSLTEYRKQKDAYFDGYKSKDNLREYLLKEQKYICCYCMQRIDKHNMKIEHWFPQNVDKNEDKELRIKGEKEQLNYRNLLAACSGNKGQRDDLHHCDTRKHNTIIRINPTIPNCEELIKFKASGQIYSNNSEIDNDLNVTLNLNMQTIVNNRKITIDTALKKLERECNATWSKEFVKKEIDKWKSPYDEKYQPYCEIVVFYLKKKLAKL